MTSSFFRFRNWVLLAATGASCAASAATLKQVQVTDGNRVDLIFDGKIAPAQVRTEFFNDIIQLSLADVNVYPAKISSVSGSELTKVFAYQYAPKLVRCRLTVKGSAETYQKRVEVKAGGNVLSIRIPSGTKLIPTGAASEDHSPAARGSAPDPEEKALLDRVIRSQSAPETPPPPQAAVQAPAPPAAAPVSQAAEAVAPKSPLTGGKPLPSPLRSFFWLGIVLIAFGAIAMVLRRFRGRQGEEKSAGLASALNRIGVGGFRRNGKMIEVVANHHLGPKKTISVVKVGGRMLVLGVTNDSVNLITQLPAEGPALDMSVGAAKLSMADLDALMEQEGRDSAPPPIQGGTGATSAGPGVFANLLDIERSTPRADGGARARIRSRMEGMKQL